jgi:flagellar protein FlaG
MLIIGGVVAAFAIFNGIYPAVQRSSEAISSAADTMNERIKSQIEIIQVGESGTTVDAWVKNVGSSEIATIENTDVFFGPVGNFARIANGDESTPLPYWTYQLEGSNTQWGQTVTNRITIHLASSPLPGTYLLKIIIPNGVYDETTFGVE